MTLSSNQAGYESGLLSLYGFESHQGHQGKRYAIIHLVVTLVLLRARLGARRKAARRSLSQRDGCPRLHDGLSYLQKVRLAPELQKILNPARVTMPEVKMLIWWIDSWFCDHDWEYAETRTRRRNKGGKARSSKRIVSATCKKCGWRRKF